MTKVIFLLNNTKIGDRACKWADNLVVVDIPEGVKRVSEEAFAWCTSLTTVYFPTTLTSIGQYAFYCCSSLENVDLLHTNLQGLGGGAFLDCSELKSMTIPGSLRNETLGDSIFYTFSKLVPSSIDINDEINDDEKTPKVIVYLRSQQNQNQN